MGSLSTDVVNLMNAPESTRIATELPSSEEEDDEEEENAEAEKTDLFKQQGMFKPPKSNLCMLMDCNMQYENNVY